MKMILANGRILDPSQDLDIVGNLVLEDSQIKEITPELDEDEEPAAIYDCTGLWITPGLVDLHAHLREPGEEHRETITTGTQAAAAGGFTTICCMPNTSPALDTPSLVDFLMDSAASPDAGGVFVAPVGALTIGQKGEQLTDLSALKSAGIVAASDEGGPIQNSFTMMRAMEFCLQLDLPILAHCEDKSLSANGVVNDGEMSALLGLPGIPRSAEELMVMRNCILSLNTGCRVHILRVSTWGSIEMIRQAKYLGAPVTCEVCPHHFALTESDMREFDVNYKTTPPLRTQIDMDMIKQAIKEGTIDCIASDHSPYSPYEMESPFEEAPFGMSSLESTVAATLTYLTHQGHLTPLETIRKLSTTPAEILRLEGGTLSPGNTPVGQVTVIDPNIEWEYSVEKTFSKGKNSPFNGRPMRGKVVLTICGSEIYRDALFSEERFHGALI